MMLFGDMTRLERMRRAISRQVVDDWTPEEIARELHVSSSEVQGYLSSAYAEAYRAYVYGIRSRRVMEAGVSSLIIACRNEGISDRDISRLMRSEPERIRRLIR